MKIKYVLFLLISFLFIQCKTTSLIQIRKDIANSYPIKGWLNQTFFDQSRALMFNSLPADIIQNDKIIILEYFTDGLAHYSFSVYQSNDQATKYFNVLTKRLNKKDIEYSLVKLDIPDKILEMVLRGELDEIKERGCQSALTPGAVLVINIGIRDEERRRFNFTTLVTRKFIVPEYWETQ